jgi:hypothetical protein
MGNIDDLANALAGSAPAQNGAAPVSLADHHPASLVDALANSAPQDSQTENAPLGNMAGRPLLAPSQEGEFSKGVRRGVDTTKASLYGAAAVAGGLTGADSLKDWGMEGVRRKMTHAALYPAKVESWDDVHSLSNLGDYVVSTVGESVPAVATFVAGGGAGSIAARAAIGKAVLQGLSKEEAAALMQRAATRGSMAGMVATDYPQQVGSTYNQLRDQGIDAPGTSLLAAVPNTALDLAGYEAMLGRAFPGLKKEMSQDLVNNLASSYKAKLGHSFIEAVKGAAITGGTMAASMPLEALVNNAARAYHDPGFDPFGPEAIASMKEAAIKGVIGGTVLGSGFHGAAGMGEALKARAEEIAPKPGDSSAPAGVSPEDLARQAQEAAAPAVVHETAPRDPNRAPDELTDDIPDFQDRAYQPESTPAHEGIAQQLADSVPQHEDALAPESEKLAPGPQESAPVPADIHPVAQALADSVPQEAQKPDAPSPYNKEEPPEPGALGEDDLAAFNDSDHHVKIHAETPDDRTWSEEVRYGYGAGRPKYDYKQLDEHGNPKQVGVTKPVEFQKLKTVAERMRQVFPDVETKIDEDKKAITYKKVMDPSGIRDPEETQRGYSAFLKMLLNGEANQASKGGARLFLSHPEILSKSKDSKGAKAEVRISAHELTDFGAALNDKKGALSAMDARASIMSALAWMYDHGFRGRDGGFHLQHQGKGFEAVPGKKGEVPAKVDHYADPAADKSQPMADSAIVYNRNGNPWTWGYLTKELPREVEALRTKLENAKPELSAEHPTAVGSKERAILERRKAQIEGKLRDLVGPETDESIDLREEEPAKTHAQALEDYSRDPKSYDAGVDTEAKQARNSVFAPSKVVHVQPKSVSDKYVTTTRDAKGNVVGGDAKTGVYGGEHLQTTADVSRKVLDHIGLGHVVMDFVDQLGLEHHANDPRYKDQIAELKKSDVVGQIIFPKGERLSGPERRPLIYISDKVTDPKARAFVTLHELGHLVQRTHFDQAKPEVRKAVMDALGEHNFDENFANEFAKWAYARGDLFGKRATGKVGEFFKGMVDSLKKMWNEFRKRLGVDLTFASYMDSLLATGLSRMGEKDNVGPTTDYGKRAEAYWKQRRRMQEQLEGQGVSAFLPENMMGPLTMNFPGEGTIKQGGKHAEDILRVALGDARTEQTKKWMLKRADNAQSFFQIGYDSLFRTTASHVRGVASERFQKMFGDQFIHETNKETSNKNGTFSQSVAMHEAPLMHEMQAIYEELPKRVNMFERAFLGKTEDAAKVAEYKKLTEQLWSGAPRSELSPTGVKIRDILQKLYIKQSEMDVPLRHMSTDMPVMFNREMLRENRDKVIKGMVDKGINEFDAVQRYQDVVDDPSVFFHARDPGKLDGFLSAESYNDHRAMPPEVFEHFKPYAVDDVYDTMMTYIHSAVRRAVMQEKFGFNSYERADHPRNEYLHNDLQTSEINLYAPTAKLDYNLRLMAQNGEISQTEHDQAANKWLPALLGRPTAQIDPRWNKVQGALMVWQNWAHMALSVFSQFNDLGAGAWRFNAPMETLTKSIQYAFSKATREQMNDYAKLVGFMHNSVVSNIVSDVGNGNMYGSKFAKKWNDKLFTYNGMHWWTNMSHAVFADIARERIETWAKGAERDPSMAAALKEIGTDAATVKAWLDAGSPMEAKAAVYDREGFNGVRSALFQLVDEAVLRPDASMRPGWANNRNLAIFWQLKSWTWGFGHRFVMTAIRQGKDQEGIRKLFPILALAAYTAPMSILGVSIRNAVTQSQRRDLQDPLDYTWEGLQQAGVFGPGQVFIDAEQAKSRGHTALASVLGPVFSTMDDFMRSDSSYVLKNSLPASGIIKGIERWAK